MLIHFKIEMDLVFLPFSGEKLVYFKCVAAKGNMTFHGLPRQGKNKEKVLQGLGRFYMST